MILAMLLLTTPVPATTPAVVTEPNPKKMSQSAIRAHNAELPRDHPYFIRCVKNEEIGSLIKRKLSCRTNEQWAAAEKIANDEARDIADEMRSKSQRTSG